MKITTLGTSHGAPEKGRSCSGTLVTINGANYLFDCGGDVEAKLMNLGISHESVKAIFVSHMHEDHAGKLTGMIKHFLHYNKTPEHMDVFMPEENGAEILVKWCEALHMTVNEEKVSVKVIAPGDIYEDENIKVSAIATEHIQNGKFPSFAFTLCTADEKMLYTGDLACNFHDYPTILFEEKFDAVVSELVHFDVAKNLDSFMNTKTDNLIFTHMIPDKAQMIEQMKADFPFKVFVANDCDSFDI